MSAGGDDVFSTYLAEIHRIPLLSRQEERALARRAKKGDCLAEKRLIQANLRFVVKVAKSFRVPGLPLEDLVSEGNIGLMKALKHFDPDRGCHFISYAVWWIRQSILRAIGEKCRAIRLPQNKVLELQRIEKVREGLLREQGREPSTEEIARRLNRHDARVRELLRAAADVLSLDAPAGSDDESSPLEDYLEDGRNRLPEENLLRSSVRDEIDTVLRSLPRRESEILRSRYGLNGGGPMSLASIGGRWKLTKERVRQIEKKAIARLRDSSSLRMLEAS